MQYNPEMNDEKNKMTQQEIKNRFNNETADLYSQKIPNWFPEVEFAFQLIADTLKSYIKPESKILDLGAGTGNLSKMIFQHYPFIDITLLDFSENMLNQVENVLKDYKDRYQTLIGDIFNFTSKKNEYNHAISSFAIHHARGEKVYLKLYKRIYNCLIAPGTFICCDVIEGDNKNLSKQNEDGWANYLKKQGFTEEQIINKLSNYHREDSPLSINKHLNLLTKAGFKTVDILWKKFNFCVYIGIKE